MTFEFATAQRIAFGAGKLSEAGPAAQALGRRALVVTGAHPERAASLFDQLRSHRVEALPCPIRGEPKIDDVAAGARLARYEACELVIGFGGGSAIDAAKAIAALATNPGELLDYLEVIGRGQPLTENPLPVIAVPTTAGTGAEVTRNAVLASPEHQVKASLRHPLMLPRLAIVDSRLSQDLPPALTAATGMDALTQLIEPFVCLRANPLTDGFCREGITRAARSLRKAFYTGNDADAREDMALASLLGGLALANAGLGAVHGFAAPIGGMFAAPHGAVCAALLPIVMETNLRALRTRAADSNALNRYEEVGRRLTEGPQATADEGVAWVRELCRDLQIPPLRTYGITAADVPDLVEKSSRASSMKANPVQLPAQELADALHAAL
jgi:alcohol dehydrogenase class IV